jgi:isoleucyl-tRNA synthetase
MDVLLHLVSLGSAARNQAKIKVRQPLAEMRVDGDAKTRKVVERFRDIIGEELNIKKITLHDEKHGRLLRPIIKPKRENLGPRLGSKLKEVLAALATLDPWYVREMFDKHGSVKLDCPSGGELLLPTEVSTEWKATEEGWMGAYDQGIMVAVDTRISHDLAREGMAREVVRHIQNARKDANLNMEDRIVLSLQTQSAALAQAIEAHKDYICNETLAVRLTNEPLGGEVYRTEVKVDGQALTIELRKATG